MTQDIDEKPPTRIGGETLKDATPAPTAVGMVQNTRPSNRPGAVTLGFGAPMPGAPETDVAPVVEIRGSALPPSVLAPTERAPWNAAPLTALPAVLTPSLATPAADVAATTLSSMQPVIRAIAPAGAVDAVGPTARYTGHDVRSAIAQETAPTAAGIQAPSSAADVSLADTQMGPSLPPQGPTNVTISYAETVAGPSGALVNSMAPTGTLSRHSTVLPHVEHGGAEPRLVPRSRDRYERVKSLGEGGVGEVLLARDHDIDRKVAIKSLKPDMRATGHVIRFVDEVRTVGSLEHPNIVPIHDVGVDAQGQFFFVMKYVAGDTLEAVIERLAAGDAAMHKRFPFSARVQVFRQVLRAVQYAHAQGIVHRDLKPADIMLGEFGEVMVMDWGLAKRIRRGETGSRESEAHPDEPDDKGTPKEIRARLFKTRHGTLLGTPAYMSPEQAKALELDQRSDLYSLGALFNELLTLRHYLHDKRTLPEMLGGVHSVEVSPFQLQHDPFAGSVPHGLTYFVARAMKKIPAERYQSADEMAAALDEYLAGDIRVTCHVTALQRGAAVGKKFAENMPYLAYFGLVSTVGFAGFGVFSLVSRLLH